MKGLISYSRDELAGYLAGPGEPMLPELEWASEHPAEARERPATQLLLEGASGLIDDIEAIPQLTYTLYRDVQRYTDRIPYQQARQQKRSKMGLTALLVLLGEDRWVDLLHDYIWSTCEETNWVLPQVEHMGIELRVPATSFSLAEIIQALGQRIEDRAVERVRQEVETRVFGPYLADPGSYW